MGDTMFQGQSESYASASVHYAMLRRLAEMDGGVAKTLQPISQFFAARPATKKTTAPTTSVTPSSTATTAATVHGTPGSPVTEAAASGAPSPAPVSVTHS
jgi:hypothetical protein